MEKLQGWQVENILTLAITGLSVVGLYGFGAGAYSFWPFIFMVNLNTIKRTKAGEK